MPLLERAPAPPEAPATVTVMRAADFLEVSPQTIYRYLKAQPPPFRAQKVVGTWHIRLDDLEALKRARTPFVGES